MKLALQENEIDFLEKAQSSAVDTWSLARVETLLQEEAFPDADLIRSVLIALKSKLPDAEIDLDVNHNIKSCIPVHANVLVAVASLGIRLSNFYVHSSILGKLEKLLPELLTCTSDMVGFAFSNNKIHGVNDNSEDGNVDPASEMYSMLRTLLASADNLRKLGPNFSGFRSPDSILQLTSELLLAGLHPMLHSLELMALTVSEATLLKAFSSWSGQLEKLVLTGVYLWGVEEGVWADVMRTLTAMPRLRETCFYILYSMYGTPPVFFVDFGHLKCGQVMAYHKRGSKMLKKISFRDDNEVATGLQELLGGDGSKYHWGQLCTFFVHVGETGESALVRQTWKSGTGLCIVV